MRIAGTTTGIPGARVFRRNPPQGTLTDSQGHYVLEGLRVGSQNSPVQADITAEADGFYPLTEPVTLFCNANLTINFGDPPEKARIIVKKMTEPASTDATFAFTRTFGPDFTVQAGGSFDTGPLVPGSGYSIAESPSALWEPPRQPAATAAP